MPLTKEQKQKVLEDLKESIAKAKAVVLVGITGLKVKEVSELKKRLKAIDGRLKVAKKTLTELAFKDNKLDFDKDAIKEEMALIFGFKEGISTTKAIYQFSQDQLFSGDKLKILSGFVNGKPKTSEEIIILAQLPTKEELLAKLVLTIANPISGLVRVLQGNIKGLIFSLNAISESK
jgi:large subunit ribosomal protein L10